MSGKPILLAVAGAMLLTGACARVPRDAGFSEVRKLVGERGIEQVRWNRGLAEDQAVAEAVRRMTEGDLTADAAVQIALLNNRRLQATYEELAVAQADLVQAGLLKNPVFDAEFRFDEHTGDLTFEGSILQDFVNLFQIPLRKWVAAAEFEAAKHRIAGEVLDLAGRTRSAFYRLQAEQQMVEMRRVSVESLAASVEVARRLREAGNITELAYAQQQAEHEQARVELADAEARMLAERERMNALLGLWGSEGAWKIAGRLLEPPDEELPLERVEGEAVARSLELGAQRQQIAVASQRLGLAQPFALLPEGEGGVGGEYTEGEGWAMGPAVSVPVPLFDQGQARVAAAQAELRRARQVYHARAVEIRAEARAAAIELRAARDRVEHYQRVLLPLRQRVLEQTQLQYNAMQAGVFELLQAKRQQVETGAQYIQSLRDYWLARSAVGQAMNGRVSGGGAGGAMSSGRQDGERGGH